jgi:chromosome segregation ATPase
MARKTSAPEKSDAAERPMTSEAVRLLERMNKELHTRVKALESGGAGDAGHGGGHEASDESGGFSAMVKDLHGEIDAAYVLKDALKTDLETTQKRLAEEEAVRAQLETRLSLLEAKAALADQLREDMSFVEEEQNETSRRLKEATSKLDRAVEERDRLAEQKALGEERVMQLQHERFDLEAQVLGLKERLAEMVSQFGGKQTPSS